MLSITDFRVPRPYLAFVTDRDWAAEALASDPAVNGSEDSLSSIDFVRLALRYVRTADDEGWASGQRFPLGTFSLLVMAAAHGVDLADALRRMVDAIRILRPDLIARTHRGRRTLTLSLIPRAAPTAEIEVCVEFFALALHCALRWLSDACLKPCSVRAAREQVGNPSCLLNIFGCQLRRMGSGVTIHYHPGDAEAPLRFRRYESWAAQELPEFYKLLQEAVDAGLSGTPHVDRHIISRVEQLIRAGLKGEARIATELGLSPASFRRRMAETGLSYRQLVDGVRHDAVYRSLQTDKSLADIAAEAGFSDVRALRRACVKWFGIPPGAYRKSAGGRHDHASCAPCLKVPR